MSLVIKNSDKLSIDIVDEEIIVMQTEFHRFCNLFQIMHLLTNYKYQLPFSFPFKIRVVLNDTLTNVSSSLSIF